MENQESPLPTVPFDNKAAEEAVTQTQASVETANVAETQREGLVMVNGHKKDNGDAGFASVEGLSNETIEASEHKDSYHEDELLLRQHQDELASLPIFPEDSKQPLMANAGKNEASPHSSPDRSTTAEMTEYSGSETVPSIDSVTAFRIQIKNTGPTTAFEVNPIVNQDDHRQHYDARTETLQQQYEEDAGIIEQENELEQYLEDYDHPKQHDEEFPANSGNNNNSAEVEEGRDLALAESSSNDDSSYFADPNHLPSPKSGRPFSYSAGTTRSPPHQYQQHPLPPHHHRQQHHHHHRATAAGRESDASLSLSDDSDDAAHHHQNPRSGSATFASNPRPNPVEGVPEVYPQRITRVHSVSSLVSTSSQNSSASDELSIVAGTEPSSIGQMDGPVPSGRLSPILGEHPPSRQEGMFFSSPSSINPGPSPPTIVPGYPHHPFVFPHPQPHPLVQQPQGPYGAWMMAGHAAAGTYPFHPSRPLVDTSAVYSRESLKSNDSGWSKDTLAYSEDTQSMHTSGFGSQIPPRQQPTSGQGRSKGAGDDASALIKRSVNSEGSSLFGSGINSIGELADDAFEKQREASRRSLSQGGVTLESDRTRGGGYKVYWQRWLMLFYMSVLNLLSDWTCYSVAPIAVLTEEAFGRINAEQLVVVFLAANAIATACEPVLLSRLGLRRTVLFGALLLMVGSIVKSGGMPPIIQANLRKGEGEWRVYLGFFLVGLSQPLYQCTPALLSASWFPEHERTMATGVALNANQIGIGFAFIFGTMLVATSDDIPGYFGLLSIISTITFLGTLFQFDDAPLTPPSDTAKVMRGTLEVGLPSVRSIFQSVRSFAVNGPNRSSDQAVEVQTESIPLKSSITDRPDVHQRDRQTKEPRNTTGSSLTLGSHGRRGNGTRRSGRPSSHRKGHRTSTLPESSSGRQSGSSSRRKSPTNMKQGQDADPITGSHRLAPSPAPWGPAPVFDMRKYLNPSPMLPGKVAPAYSQSNEGRRQEQGLSEYSTSQPSFSDAQIPGHFYGPPQPFPMQDYPSYQYQTPYWDPRLQQYPNPYYFQQMYYNPPPNPYHYNYGNLPPPYYMQDYESPQAVLPSPEAIDEGAEPVLTLTPHHLDINIRDDQILLSTRACLARPGFVHALVAFTVSGIVINTLSTFMDYLVRLNGVGREYTGIVGGSFQFVIMISSLIMGTITDKTRAYYSVTVGMLVLGAFGLAECGVNLEADSGTTLRLSLVIVAALVGPLQPVSTELGVDVVYPLSENTVLVIQQLFSNLLSALFIPCFKALKDFGRSDAADSKKPEYTFSFYLLIVLHATATVFFATFNGRYLRYEHELAKKAEEDRKNSIENSTAFRPIDQTFQQFHFVGIPSGIVRYPEETDAMIPTHD